MATDTGTGAAVTFQSGLLAAITSIDWSMSREAIETTSMATSGRRTYIPAGNADAGEITVEADLDDQVELWADTVEAAAETITVTFPGSVTWAASGFTTSSSFSIPNDDKMTASLTFKLTGDVTVG